MTETAPKTTTGEPPTSQNMLVWGWVIALIGLGLMVWAFLMKVTVEATPDYGGGLASGMPAYPTAVVNLGLLSTREMTLTAGCALLVAGIVLVAAGHIRKGLELLASK